MEDDDEFYFDDLSRGDTFDCGSYAVTAQEIKAYANQWDPLPFHVDVTAGQESMYGGLIASGIHTIAICNKLAAENLYVRTSTMGGPGLEDPTFHQPVRPGDILSVSVEIVEKIPSTSKPDRGLVKFKQTVSNQETVVVFTMKTLSFLRRR